MCNDGHCTSTCDGAGSHCGERGYNNDWGHCAWSTNNQCTLWCAYCSPPDAAGNCSQLCCDGKHHADLQMCTCGGGGGGGGHGTTDAGMPADPAINPVDGSGNYSLHQ
jgi:hypothetical protein